MQSSPPTARFLDYESGYHRRGTLAIPGDDRRGSGGERRRNGRDIWWPGSPTTGASPRWGGCGLGCTERTFPAESSGGHAGTSGESFDLCIGSFDPISLGIVPVQAGYTKKAKEHGVEQPHEAHCAGGRDGNGYSNNESKSKQGEAETGLFSSLSICAGREKGKKVLHTKDELLVSVRKAFSMLSDMDCSHGKDANFTPSPRLHSASTSSCDVKEKCSDKPSSLVKDPLQTEVCNTILHCPKDILSRLTLPQGHDLDTLLSAGSESSAAVPSMTVHGASLPPFPWSHSQAGGYRPSVDSGKHGSSRSNSHWQWMKVGSYPTALDYEESTVHKIDDLLQEMDMVKSSIIDSCGRQSNLCCTESTSGSFGQTTYSKKIGSEHGGSSDNFQRNDSEHSLLKTPQASRKILRAAETLCDMRRSTECWSAQGYSNGTIKWPKSPPEKVKARKPSSPFGTAESSSGSRNSDAARTGNGHSTKKIVDRKNDSACMSNPGKGSIRWPVPIEDAASPVRPEKGLALDTRQTHGNAARHPTHVSSQARLEKEYENQQKLRKATLASSLGSGGDWNRERNRRM
uniref:Uncharacterized protein n=1 Tax=Avena sativa TaxID=4498 RepID=A0ACD6AQ59_AVESA